MESFFHDWYPRVPEMFLDCGFGNLWFQLVIHGMLATSVASLNGDKSPVAFGVTVTDTS